MLLQIFGLLVISSYIGGDLTYLVNMNNSDHIMILPDSEESDNLPSKDASSSHQLDKDSQVAFTSSEINDDEEQLSLRKLEAKTPKRKDVVGLTSEKYSTEELLREFKVEIDRDEVKRLKTVTTKTFGEKGGQGKITAQESNGNNGSVAPSAGLRDRTTISVTLDTVCTQHSHCYRGEYCKGEICKMIDYSPSTDQNPGGLNKPSQQKPNHLSDSCQVVGSRSENCFANEFCSVDQKVVGHCLPVTNCTEQHCAPCFVCMLGKICHKKDDLPFKNCLNSLDYNDYTSKTEIVAKDGLCSMLEQFLRGGYSRGWWFCNRNKNQTISPKVPRKETINWRCNKMFTLCICSDKEIESSEERENWYLAKTQNGKNYLTSVDAKQLEANQMKNIDATSVEESEKDYVHFKGLVMKMNRNEKWVQAVDIDSGMGGWDGILKSMPEAIGTDPNSGKIQSGLAIDDSETEGNRGSGKPKRPGSESSESGESGEAGGTPGGFGMGGGRVAWSKITENIQGGGKTSGLPIGGDDYVKEFDMMANQKKTEMLNSQGWLFCDQKSALMLPEKRRLCFIDKWNGRGSGSHKQLFSQLNQTEIIEMGRNVVCVCRC